MIALEGCVTVSNNLKTPLLEFLKTAYVLNV